jgi:hypothetical protein
MFDTTKIKDKEHISKILVKWSMPTRQVAINELCVLIQTARKEERKKIRHDIATIAKNNTDTMLGTSDMKGFSDDIVDYFSK